MSNINPYSTGESYAAAGAAIPAAFAEESARAGFIRRTYLHLAAAVFALVGLEAAIFALVPRETIEPLVMRMTGGMGWLVALGVFMAVSWLARMWATSDTSPGVQYLGLGLYVVAEAAILLPLLYIAVFYVDPQLPLMAAIITLACFGGLTAFVMTTRVDLASWGKYLAIGGFIALGAIAASIITGGFSLGILFSAAMVALACGYILYDTSNVLHHYRTDQYVAASLALFASVVLLFWYVLRIMMMFASDD
jgi:FtsH-binding integral membrane protein